MAEHYRAGGEGVPRPSYPPAAPPICRLAHRRTCARRRLARPPLCLQLTPSHPSLPLLQVMPTPEASTLTYSIVRPGGTFDHVIMTRTYGNLTELDRVSKALPTFLTAHPAPYLALTLWSLSLPRHHPDLTAPRTVPGPTTSRVCQGAFDRRSASQQRGRRAVCDDPPQRYRRDRLACSASDE